MSSPLNNHLPQVAGGATTIPAATGTLIIDTGLRNLQAFSVSLAQDSGANAASLSFERETRVAGTTQKVEVKSWKADGATAGSVAAKVEWVAIGN